MSGFCTLVHCKIYGKRKEIESLLSHFVLNKYQITSLLLAPNPPPPKVKANYNFIDSLY